MDTLQKRIESLNEALVLFETENKKLQKLNEILVAEKKQYEQMKIIQDQIIQQSLNRSNELNNQYLKQIQELKDRL